MLLNYQYHAIIRKGLVINVQIFEAEFYSIYTFLFFFLQSIAILKILTTFIPSISPIIPPLLKRQIYASIHNTEI